jgi:hypothetical protein
MPYQIILVLKGFATDIAYKFDVAVGETSG